MNTEPVRVLAIDGPEASGKTTAAQELALMLGYEHLDSGSLYRTSTMLCLENRVDVQKPEEVIEIMEANIHRISMRKSITHLDGIAVGTEIRTPEIGRNVKYVSEIPRVRELLCRLQRSCINDVGLVAEGRDLTSVVFTDALLKIFLTASPEVRAKRRFEEWQKRKKIATYDEVLADLIARDKRDSERACCPLKHVEDAYLVKTDEMSPNGVVDVIHRLWLSKVYTPAAVA